MQWRVSISNREQIVSIPDNIPDDVPFDGSIDGRPLKLRWQRSTRSLYILVPGTQNFWSSINIRSMDCSRFVGEPDLNISSEFVLPGHSSALSLESSVCVHIPGQEARASSVANKPRIVRSQITGKVIKVFVRPGSTVAPGDTLCIIEAMKMENKVMANNTGIIDQVKINEGDTVSAGGELVRFKQS